MRHQFNLKAFLYVAGAFIAFGATLYAAHSIQQPRNASALLAKATREEAEQRYDLALRFLDRYLTLNPADPASRYHYGEILEKAAGGGKSRFLAIDVYLKVLAQDPGRLDARRRLALLLTDAGRWNDALAHLQILRDACPADGTIDALLGRCFAVQHDWNSAANYFESACNRLPDPEPETFAYLADCFQRVNKTTEADAAIDSMVKRFSGDFRVYLIRSRYRFLYKKPGSDDDLLKAKQLAPDDPDVLLATADALNRTDLEAAQSELKRGLAIHQKDSRFYLALSQLYLMNGKRDEAIALLQSGVKALPDQAAILVELVHELIDLGEIAAARAALTSAKTNPKLRLAPNDSELLTARLAAADGNWSEAAPLLNSLRRRVPAESPQAAMIDRILSRNAARLGDLDKQIELLRSSLAITSTPSARLEYAFALVDVGNMETAVREFRILADANPPSIPACLALVRWETARLVETVGPGGNWSEVKRLLDRAKKASPQNLMIAVAEVETLAASGRAKEARANLEAMCKIAPPTVEPWIARLNLEIQAENMDAARTVLKDATLALGNRLTVRLMAIILAAQEPRAQALADTAKTTERLDELPPDQAVRVWGLAAVLYMKLERYDLAGQAASRVASLRPENLQSQLLRFEAAVRGKDDATAEAAIEAVRRIEGPRGGLASYCDAVRIIFRASDLEHDAAKLAQARDLLTEAAARRPRWPKVPLLRAQLEGLEGQHERAMLSYREAFDQGERSFEIVRRLFNYYVSSGRYPEAYDLIRRLQEKDAISLAEQRMFTEVYLQAADYTRALESAKKVIATSTNPNDYIWLSFVYSAVKKFPEARAALEQACQLIDTPEPWIPWKARVQFLVAHNLVADADAIVREIQQKVPRDKLARTLAECNEVLNREVEADRHYQSILEAAPNDWKVVSTVAAYYQRTHRFARAEPLLRKLIDGIPGVNTDTIHELRRELAIGLAESGNFHKCSEGLALIAQNVKEAGEERADTLARAVVLAKRPGGKLEAIRLFEKLSEKPLSAEARYIFGQLLIITGGVSKGREQILLAISQSQENPAYVEYWAKVLIADKNYEDARFWVSKLALRGADSWTVVDFQAQLQQARGQTSEALARLARYTPKNDDESIAVALRLEEYKDLSAAEKRFKEFVEKKDSPPMAALLYAAFLARHERVEESLVLCEKLIGKVPTPVVAGMALEFLDSGKSDPGVHRRVEGWLESIDPDGPDARPAAFMRADALDRKGDYPGAIAAYRQLLVREHDNPLVLLPLARLLLFSGDSSAEVDGLLARAISASGPQAHLIELRAVLKLHKGQVAEAITELRQNLFEQPTATGYFRLAVACQAMKDKEGTEKALAESIRRGFTKRSLHPLEVNAYRSFCSEYPSVP
jgi:predicted Zn-dependent protease